MGPLPKYFKIWLHTCKQNRSVSFLVVGSHVPKKSKIKNVKFIRMSFEDLKGAASSKIGINVNLKSKRKICDLKPAYGDIFDEHIREFDFWGYCDMDLVWGNLDKLTSEKVLRENDVVSVRGDRFISGACSFFRNNRKMKKLYKKSPSLKKVYSEKRMVSFSEAGNRKNYKKNIGKLSKIKSEGNIVSMTDMVFHKVNENKIRFYTPEEPYVMRELKTDEKYDFKIEYSDGSLFERGRGEILGYHFLFAKKDPFFIFPRWSKIPPFFSISSKGLYPPSKNKWLYEIKRVLGGSLQWMKDTSSQKIHNARVKFSKRFGSQ